MDTGASPPWKPKDFCIISSEMEKNKRIQKEIKLKGREREILFSWLVLNTHWILLFIYLFFLQWRF